MTPKPAGRDSRRTRNADRATPGAFPGVLDVAITPDAHHGLRRAGRLRDGHARNAGHGPGGLRHRLRHGRAALGGAARERPRRSASRAFSRLVMQRVGLGKGARGQRRLRGALPGDRARRAPRRWACSRGAAERDRIPVDDDWDIPKDSRAWRGQQPARQPGRRQPLHRAAARRRAPLGDVPHRLARLRPRPGRPTTSSRRRRSWA